MSEIINKIVLIEKKQNFPLKNLERVKNTWIEGKHPEQCVGNCGIFINDGKIFCGWCKYYSR